MGWFALALALGSGAAEAAEWWVPDAEADAALTAALVEIWPAEAHEIAIGDGVGAQGFAWDGRELTDLARGTRAPAATASEAAALARSWSRPIGEDPGEWLPPLPPPPPAAPEPPARRSPWRADAAVGLAAALSEPGPLDALTLELGVGAPALRLAALGWWEPLAPGSGLRPLAEGERSFSRSYAVGAALDAGPGWTSAALRWSPRLILGADAGREVVVRPLARGNGAWGGTIVGVAGEVSRGHLSGRLALVERHRLWTGLYQSPTDVFQLELAARFAFGPPRQRG